MEEARCGAMGCSAMGAAGLGHDAINGFNLDQSIAIRIGRMVGDPSLVEIVYNKYPLYLVGPWNLTQRFLMHGFFTEHLHARLEQIRLQ